MKPQSTYHTNKVKLYWCVNNFKEAVYKDELEKISNDNPNFEFKIWPSKEIGYLTVEKMELENFNKGYLICGPSSLKENLMKQLKEKGVSNQNIYDEEFAFR